MNIPFRQPNDRGLTLAQTFFALITFITLALIVSGIMPTCCGGSNQMVRGRMADQLNNGRQIYLSLRNYASEMDHEGSFPMYADWKNRTGLVNSNDAFEVLLPRYLDDKRPFFNKNSAWCKKTTKSEATMNKVQPGENDWCYVRGLRDNSNSRWPLLANAFAPNTTTYVKDQSQRGGVWKGANAIVIWAGGSAEIVETKEAGNGYFVKRSDNPGRDAFQKDDEWLTGENVEVLYPKSN